MGLWNWLLSFLTSRGPQGTLGGSTTVDIEQTGYVKPPETDSHVRTDMKLTDHFSLFDLTKTDHTELQAANRDLTDDQVKKLTLLAELLEEIRLVINMPMVPDDAYRCPALNKVDGGVAHSQHEDCEAADWVPLGITTTDKLYPIFKIIWDAAKAKKFAFGQLLFEESTHVAGNAWIHVSLGYPYRELDKCGQVLHMKQGKYELFETITQQA
jgi:hypothetical protein